MIEAMAWGLPVLGGRCGGVTESVVEGETGYLVEPGDVDTYTRRLIQLGEDRAERLRLGQNGMDRVRRHFSPAQERDSLCSIMGLGDGAPARG